MVIFQFAKLQFAGRTWRVIRCYKQRRLDCIVKYLRWDSWICPFLFTYRWCMPVLCCLQKMWGLLSILFFTSHGQHIILQCFTLLGGVFHMVISWSYLDDCSKPQSSPSHKSTLEYCSYIMLSPYMTHMTHLVYKFTKLTTCKICQAPSFPVSRSRSPARLPPRPQLPKSHPSRALRALRRWEARRGRGGRRRPWAP